MDSSDVFSYPEEPDFSANFSDLNSRLRPRFTSTERLYCSLNRIRSKPRAPILTPRRPASLSDPEDDGPNTTDGPGAADRCILTALSLTEVREDADSGPMPSGDNAAPREERSESPNSEGRNSPFQRSYTTLPDLINGGRPLGRRRTLGHVNDTLKEVRREVELSRRRSIKLKAQVDKLQQSRHGSGWSQDRERVTEEILSILRLMQTMPAQQGGPPPELPPPGEKCLDAALSQLQDITRKMAVSGIAQKEAKSLGRRASEDGALLQQALRDRDDAIEKKKAMETELLRCKSEMMLLNNQLLEAAQKRLELSLELEAWKEDMQLLLQQQLHLQQQLEQNSKKTSRMGILRRNKAPVQRPANFPVAPGPASPDSPTPQSPTQGFIGRPQLSPGRQTSTWRWRRNTGGQPTTEAPQLRVDDGFQVVSLN
ncbi:bicaudal-D-related protein 2-like [Corythoichthys intestinalis]|uniref:bicaudal-D-related protein 2-like n=1 Tax=Corythoichthys intestinalis TaxID=161448 RepID=UPI0025A64E60|nr:bicaudal-D-related protein 2-like [Corythoichthys intestinalis]